MAHSRLSPSAASRWMGCPASVRLINELNLPDLPSDYANAGTVAHELLELCLTQELSPHFIDMEIPEDIFEAVDTAYELINDALTEFRLNYDKVELELEHRIDLSWIGIKGLEGGTADIIIRCYDENNFLAEIMIIDYKHGVGVSVEAEDNPQLLIYALGVLGENADDDTMVHLRIVQPRDFKNSNPMRKETTTVLDLYEWMSNKLKPAADKVMWETPVFGPSFKRCQFCDASAVCPKLNRDALKISELGEDAKNLSKEEQVYFFERADNIRLYLRKLETIISAKMLDGEQFPGLKVVRKVTRRRWTKNYIEPDGPIHDILGERMYKPRAPIGLGDMEKALAAEIGRKDAKALMADATWKPEGDLTVAPLSDRRRAVEVESSAKDDFKDLIEPENQ